MLPARIIADLNIGGCELMFDNFDIDVKQWGTILGKGSHPSFVKDTNWFHQLYIMKTLYIDVKIVQPYKSSANAATESHPK